MSFFLKWATRELWNDRKQSLMFVACLALGLFGFVALVGFRESIEVELRQRARSFLSADVGVSARREISKQELERMVSIIQPVAQTHVTEFFSMVAAHSESRLVQIKAIDQNYPLAGAMALGSGRAGVQLQSASQPSIWVYPELLTLLKLKVHDRIKIGSQEFTIADTVIEDTTQTFRLASLAPKIYMPRDFLDETGLLSFGSTSSDSYLFTVAKNDDHSLLELSRRVDELMNDPQIQVSTPYDAAQDSSRVMQYLLDYLGLVSLVGLSLALIGIGYLSNLFIKRRLVTLALLKILGLPEARIELFVLFQIICLSLGSLVVVVPLGILVIPLINEWLKEFLPSGVSAGMGAKFILLSAGLSIAFPILVVWPLTRLFRGVSVRSVLFEKSLQALRVQGRDVWTFAPLFLIFCATSVWISHSYRVAGIFLLSLVLAAVLVALFSRGFISVIPLSAANWRYKHAVLRMQRFGSQKLVSVIAVTFGCLLLVMLGQLRASLREDFTSPDQKKLPKYFLFDIQDEQIDSLKTYLKEKGLEPRHVSPLIRARLLSINDHSYERVSDTDGFQSREAENEARFRNRGLNLTIRAELSDSEKLTSGEWFGNTNRDQKIAEVSVEERYASRMGLRIGDQLLFDVQGVEVQGVVKNLRSVKWNRFDPNFFISVQPGFLEEAPKTWILSIGEQRGESGDQLQTELVQKFPNVSTVNVARLVQKILELTDQMSLALTGMAVLSIFVGFFILFIVMMTEAEARALELNLFRVLGARGYDVQTSYVMEAMLTSLLAASLGIGLGSLLSWILMSQVFNAGWVFASKWTVMALALSMGFSGFLSLFWSQKLLARNESSLLGEGRL